MRLEILSFVNNERVKLPLRTNRLSNHSFLNVFPETALAYSLIRQLMSARYEEPIHEAIESIDMCVLRHAHFNAFGKGAIETD